MFVFEVLVLIFMTTLMTVCLMLFIHPIFAIAPLLLGQILTNPGEEYASQKAESVLQENESKTCFAVANPQ